MERRVLRDKDLLIDKRGMVYQVIGSIHEPSNVYAFLKYVPTKGPTHWHGSGGGLRRVFRLYRPDMVNLSPKSCLSPIYRTSMPCIGILDIYDHRKPEKAVERLLYRVGDSLEKTSLLLASEMVDRGYTVWDRIGVTGSILGGFHNELHSDIDLVVYGCGPFDSLGREIGEPLKGKLFEAWVLSNAKRLGLHPSLVAQMYDPRKRFLYKGRLVSVAYAPDRERDYYAPDGGPLRPRGEYQGTVEVMIWVEKGLDNSYSCSLHYYPHLASGTVETVIRGSAKPGSLARLLIFESLFANAISKGGTFLARGPAFYDTHTDALSIVVGTRERTSFIYPISV